MTRFNIGICRSHVLLKLQTFPPLFASRGVWEREEGIISITSRLNLAFTRSCKYQERKEPSNCGEQNSFGMGNADSQRYVDA